MNICWIACHLVIKRVQPINIVIENIFFGNILYGVFNCYLAVPKPTLGHYWGGSVTHPMLITELLHVRPKSHREPHNEVGSLSLAERLLGFELETFQFWWQCPNSLWHPRLEDWVLHTGPFVRCHFIKTITRATTTVLDKTVETKQKDYFSAKKIPFS